MIAKTMPAMARKAALTAAVGALTTLGACGSINDAFDGINPIARTLDSSAKKKSASSGGDYRQPLAIPPDYSLRPPAGQAESRRVRNVETQQKQGDGGDIKVADPKKIDLGTTKASEKISRQTITTSPTSGGGVVRDGRVEKGGKSIVRDGKRSKGEDELLKRSGDDKS